MDAARSVGDRERSADVLAGNVPRDDFVDAHHRQFGPAPGGLGTKPRGFERFVRLENSLVLGRNADFPDFGRLSFYGGLFAHRRDGERLGGAAPLNIKLKRAIRAFPHEGGHLRPGEDVVSVDADDPVASR